MKNIIVPKRFTFPSQGFKSYWQGKQGKYLLSKIDYIPEYTEIKLKIPLLYDFDFIADEVVNDLYIKKGYVAADEFINKALIDGIQTIENPPHSLVKLFEQIENIPTWLDWNKLEKGAALCRRSSDFGLIVLRNFSLMGGYESSAINKPLIFTGALHKGATKRLEETTEFWINITDKNALRRNNLGFRSSIKTRLLHSYSRIMIQNKTDWCEFSWGVPLNSWDMLATNLGFSLVFIEGLKRLGFKPTNDEIEGLFHLWKYVGFLLGIKVELLPDNEQQAIRYLYEWTMTQPIADNDTIALAQALMHEPLSSRFPKYKWQKRIVFKVHLSYNTYLLGNETCDRLQIKKVNIIFPKTLTILNMINEFFIHLFPAYYNLGLNSGRNKQLKIKQKFYNLA